MRAPRLRPGDRWEIPLGPWDAGINKKTAPYLLGNNELSGGANMLFDEVPGASTKRWGSQEIAALPSGLPPKYGYVFTKDDGTEHFLISDGKNLYDTTDLSTFSDPALITGLDDTTYLQFAAAEGKCWISNGADYVMWFDGTNLVPLDREYGNAVAATTDAGTDETHIVDADLTQVDVDYWKFRKVVITSGPAAGSEAEVTAFDPATDKLTISPAITGLAAGAGYMVGVILPKGKLIRYINGTLFLADTPENRSELRFNKLADVDTGIKQSIDNPRAWPPEYQIAIAQDDGDHIYSISPEYRNRAIVSKGGALYRLEPDPVFVWRPHLISQTVGCKYPDTWAVKNEMLYFLGSERASGLLDYFMTDLVSVRPVHKDGRFIPELDNIQRGTASFKYFTRATEAQFNTGTKSTLCETAGGRLECRVIETNTDWDEIIKTKTDTCVGDSPDGAVNLIGIPPWPTRYEAKKLPASDTPPWTKWTYNAYTEATETDTLKNTVGSNGNIFYYKNDVYDSSKNTFIGFRILATGGEANFSQTVAVQNGTKAVTALFKTGRLYVNSVDICACDITLGKVLNILVDEAGNGSVYLEGVRVWTGAAAAAAPYLTYWTENSIRYGVSGGGSYYGGTGYLDFIYEDEDFFYTAAQMPAALPATGTADIVIDYTRTPKAFGKFFIQRDVDVSGETEAGTTADKIVDSNRNEDDDYWNGRTVVITTGAGAGTYWGHVTDYDKATHTLYLSMAGDPGVGAKYQILKDDGTLTILTASSADGVTPGAYSALINSHEPAVDNATALNRYLHVRLTFTRATWAGYTNYAGGPVARTLTGGFLWRLQGQQIGPAITAWKKWKSDTTEPAGTDILQEVRLAKTIAAPAEGDYAALAKITDGDNIGTVLGDAPPPPAGEGRWLDAVVEGYPATDGTSPSLDNLTANWQEGSGAVLAVAALIYKKRLYLTAISSTGEHNDLLYVLDTKNAWTIFTGLNIFRLILFKGLLYGLSSVDDKINQHEVEGLFTDLGEPIEGSVDAGEISFGHQIAELEYVKLGVAAQGSYEILLSYDGNTWASKGTTVFTGPGTKRVMIPRGWEGKRHFIRVKSAGAEAAEITLLAAGFIARAEE